MLIFDSHGRPTRKNIRINLIAYDQYYRGKLSILKDNKKTRIGLVLRSWRSEVFR